MVEFTTLHVQEYCRKWLLNKVVYEFREIMEVWKQTGNKRAVRYNFANSGMKIVAIGGYNPISAGLFHSNP